MEVELGETEVARLARPALDALARLDPCTFLGAWGILESATVRAFNTRPSTSALDTRRIEVPANLIAMAMRAAEWHKLPTSLTELCINTTLRCGQSFRYVASLTTDYDLLRVHTKYHIP